MIFRREEGEGVEKRNIEYEYTVNNIPESISVTTLLRQFIKPKKVYLQLFYIIFFLS